jgi:hypothetical protein
MNYIRKIKVLAWILVICWFRTATATLTFVQEIEKATVFFFTYDSTLDMGSGTGVLAHNHKRPSHPLLVTNKHLLEKKVKIALQVGMDLVKPDGSRKTIKVFSECRLADKNGKLLWRSDPDDPLCDLAVLELDEFHDTLKGKEGWLEYDALPPIAFANDEDFFEGDHVYYIGHPLGIHGTDLPRPITRQGIVASRSGKKLRYLFPRGCAEDVYIIEAWGLKGSSGSPVILSPFTDVSLSSFPRVIKFIGITCARKLRYHTLDTTAVIVPSDSCKRIYDLPDTISCRIKTVVPENTGLYFVVPARKIRKVLAQFDKTWAEDD